MKKFFTLIAATLMAVGGATAQTIEKTIVLGTPSGTLATYSDEEGIITITDNSSNANGIQTGSNSYKINDVVPMKLSGSRNLAISYKAGVTINSVTLYATTNSTATGTLGTSSTDADSYGNLPARGSSTPLEVDIKNATVLRGSTQWLAVIVIKYQGEATAATAATTWDFTVTSEADSLALATNDNWTYTESGSRFQYKNEVAANTFVDLGDIGFAGGAGIQVARTSKMSAGSAIRVDVNNRLQLNCSNGQIRIPNLAKDDVVKIRFASASDSDARTFTVTNGTPATINATVSEDPKDDTKTVADKLEESITVSADGNLTLLQSKAINIYAIAVNTDLPANTTGISTVAAADQAKAQTARKYIDGKQIIIEKNGKKYNVAGAEVK